MRCSACSHENRPLAKFCAGCGAPLARRCASCSAELPAAARFCDSCGAPVEAAAAAAAPARTPGSYTPQHLAEKILTSRSALEGERRVVTVLFTDCAGFTSIAEKLDPEDVHKIMEGCFERIAAEIHRLEGTINQYRGDGVMALFGAPVAHEDGPRRAAHAALGIQRSLTHYADEVERRYGVRLRMRIGLNTGECCVGNLGSEQRFDYSAKFGILSVGSASIQVAEIDTVRGQPAFLFRFSLDGSALLFKIQSSLESWTSIRDFRSLRFRQDSHENSKRYLREYETFSDSGYYRQTQATATTPNSRPFAAWTVITRTPECPSARVAASDSRSRCAARTSR
jgi:class 3 adenylate cyclase